MQGMGAYDTFVRREINYLSEVEEFTEIAHNEAQARGLAAEDVVTCARSIYDDLGRPKSPDKGILILSDTDFTAKERTAIIAFMKMQIQWYFTVSWREEVSGKADKGNLQGY